MHLFLARSEEWLFPSVILAWVPAQTERFPTAYYTRTTVLLQTCVFVAATSSGRGNKENAPCKNAGGVYNCNADARQQATEN